MATKRRAPPKKQPSPPPPPHPDDDVDEDERSSSEEESEVEQDRKPSEESEALDDEDDGEEDGGDVSGDDVSESESESESEPEPEEVAANPPRPLAVAADEDDDDGENDVSGEEDSESEEQPNPSSQNSNIARAVDATGNRSEEKSVPVSESEEEDSKSEEEETNPILQNSAVARPANANGNPFDKKLVPASESMEEDSESEEEQLNPSPRNSVIARPADANGNPSDKKSVPAAASRKVAAASPKSATANSAKKLFQRIWSDEDQMALLQGMLDYVGTKGKDPVSNMEDFRSFIRKKLSFPVTESQLMTKIRTVRRKYRSNQRKDRAFSKTYDAEVFELSKKVWGAAKKNTAAVENGETGGGKKRMSDQLDKEVVQESAGEELMADMLWKDGFVDVCKEQFGCDEYSAWSRINSMEESERKSLQSLWKKLKVEEMRCFEKRMSLEFDSLETIF